MNNKSRLILPEVFVNLSYKLGLDNLLVQGAGGNTSYKQDGKMWIKASGKWLSNSKKENIFVLVDLESIQYNIIKNKADPLKQSVINSIDLRPSIETTLHALMPHKVVLHTHPVDLLGWIVRKDGRERLAKVLSGISWAWVPYARPGIDLTLSIQKIVENGKVDVLVLGNHGLVVGGTNCIAASTLMDKILSYCKTVSRVVNLKDVGSIKQLAIKTKMRLPRYSIIHYLALDDVAYKYCTDKNGMLYPDQVVFLGSTMSYYDKLNSEQSLAEYIAENNFPSFIIIRGTGVLVSDNAKKDVDEMLRCHAEVLTRIGANEKLRYLTENEVDGLLNWEPEKYRRSLNN